jgi:cell division protein FtsL
MSVAASREVRAHARGRQSHLRVVRRTSRNLMVRSKPRRLAPVVIFGAIAVLGIVFTILLEQVVLAQSAFKLARIRERLVRAEARHHELLVDASMLESSDRIEWVARNRLNMVAPHPEQIHYIVADITPHPRPEDVQRNFATGGGGFGQAAADYDAIENAP